MHYIRQHISTIIAAYDGSLPLAHFLKNYFRQYPKLGSRDRRMLTALAYSWYRCAKGIESNDWHGLLMGQMFSNPDQFRNFSLTDWLSENNIPFNINTLLTPSKNNPNFKFQIPNSTQQNNPNSKSQIPNPTQQNNPNSKSQIPNSNQLSDGLTRDAWLRSMLTQPDLFIRIRKDKNHITSLLSGAQIPYTFITDTCMALPNGSKIEHLLPPDSYVVQDASSQQTGTYFTPQKGEHWYDCCAGAGGKSLLLKDLEPTIHLTVSDIRGSIIHNLEQRFQQYGHKLPVSIVTDLSDAAQTEKALHKKLFDNIICDAPCSGSGTWARTPEQLYFFNPESLEKFTTLQKSILTNVSRHLKPGGRLFYITCSVFKQENEDVINDMLNSSKDILTLEQSHLINGIPIKADSMFVAVLFKPLADLMIS